MEQATLTIPQNVAEAIKNGSTTPLDRRLLELAAIEAHREGLLTEWEVIDMLGFEDREELWEFFKRYDVRSDYTIEDIEEQSAALEALLAKHNR